VGWSQALDTHRKINERWWQSFESQFEISGKSRCQQRQRLRFVVHLFSVDADGLISGDEFQAECKEKGESDRSSVYGSSAKSSEGPLSSDCISGSERGQPEQQAGKRQYPKTRVERQAAQIDEAKDKRDQKIVRRKENSANRYHSRTGLRTQVAHVHIVRRCYLWIFGFLRAERGKPDSVGQDQIDERTGRIL